MQNGFTTHRGDWVDWIQIATAIAIPCYLFWKYRRFVVGLIRFSTRYLGLTAVLVVLYLMVYGLLGAGLGIPYLFWHDDFWSRASSSTGATLLLAVVGMIAYYLDPNPWTTDRRTADFLQGDERIRHQIETWYSRKLSMVTARAEDPQWAGTGLRRWDYLVFGLNILVDPIVITPFQSWLEPDRANSLRLQRFLRAARGPFLLLLLAPALVPVVFSEVPHAAPTGHLGLERWSKTHEPPTYDVTRDFWGYLIGLASWLLGIWVGVLVIKLFIRTSTLLYHTPLVGWPEQLLAGLEAGIQQNRVLGSVRGFYRGMGQVLGAGPTAGPQVPIEPLARCSNAGSSGCPGRNCPRAEPTSQERETPNCLARRQLRVAAFLFAFLFLGTYGLLGYIRHLRVTDSLPQYPLFGLPLFDLPPAFAICAALAIVAMGYATIAYLPRFWQIPVALSIVGWMAYANNDPFKFRFEHISYEKRDIVPLRKRVIEAYDTAPEKRSTKVDPQDPPTALIPDIVALECWKGASADGGVDLDSQGRPKLVLVAVSGGASRSAYWTAVVLDRLERTLADPSHPSSFGRRVRIISGASGGMLGAACYVTYRARVARGESTERAGAGKPAPSVEPTAILPSWIRDDLPTRSMDPLARGIALSEVWKAAWPGAVREDRGVILERDWRVLQYPIVNLAGLEAEGKIPSIIFSPMIVEDGRRLLISNLELGRDVMGEGWASSYLVESSSPQINHDEFAKSDRGDGTVTRRYSLSSLEYFRIFPGKAHRDLYLSTAVRMSASFPFVSPAVNLPTDPPRRVVDAGYYDNYGIQVAISWIRRNRDWLAQNTSGVLLVQIRDSSSVRDRLDVNDAKPGVLGTATRGFQFLTSPIDAVTEARYTTASFRNDADVASEDSFGWNYGVDGPGKSARPFEPASFFTTVIFENSAAVSLDTDDFWEELTRLEQGQPVKRDFREVSMSWYLARAEMSATAGAIPDEPPPASPGKPDWTDGETRRKFMDRLNGELNSVDAPLPPGPDREIRLKRLDQLYNYERLVNLQKWWKARTR